jgi:hypothetical protein
MDCTENASNNSSIVACVFIATVMFLLRRCLATIRDTHTDTQDRWDEFMKYTNKIGSGDMIYIPRFIKID